MREISKNKIYMIFGIVMLIIALAGSAYAYYSVTANAKISGTAGGGNLTLKVEKLSTSAKGDLIPMDNDTTTLNKAILGEGNTTGSFDSTKACIDKNGYTACQIYKITISNNSSISITLNGGVTLSGDNTPNIECAVMDNTNTLTSNTSCQGKKTLANKYSLGANTSIEYYILVYIKNIDSLQTDTGDFTGIVTFTSSDGSEVKARFEDDPALTTLNNLGLSVDTSLTPDFTTVSGNSGVKYVYNESSKEFTESATGLGDGTNGIYIADDNLGASYYFRGNITNNYVYFAKNWWRIIRINGDGTIRMIYTNNPNDSSSSQYIGKSAYNEFRDYNAYVGYMYGTAGSSTYEETHANINDSTIKGVIDSWYQNNLSSYSKYIADAIYCNDREVVTGVTNGNNTYNGNGAGMNNTAYASLKRNHIDHNPTLKCTNNNDKFTVSSELGNGALTYPIGLTTVDEIVMSGGYAYDASASTSTYIKNDNYYLYPKGGDYYYWTMTPSFLTQYVTKFGKYYGDADVGLVDDGRILHGAADASVAVRPVISLLSDAITGGEGTSTNPFYVNEKYPS